MDIKMVKSTRLLVALSLIAVMCVAISACRHECYSLLLTKDDIEELASVLTGDKNVAAFFSKRNLDLDVIDSPKINLSDGYPLSLKMDEIFSTALLGSSSECASIFRTIRTTRIDQGEVTFESVVLIYRDKAPYLDQIKEFPSLGFTVGPSLSMFNRNHLRYLDDRIGLVFDHPRIKVRNLVMRRSEGRENPVHIETFTLSKEPSDGKHTYFIVLRAYRA